MSNNEVIDELCYAMDSYKNVPVANGGKKIRERIIKLLHALPSSDVPSVVFVKKIYEWIMCANEKNWASRDLYVDPVVLKKIVEHSYVFNDTRRLLISIYIILKVTYSRRFMITPHYHMIFWMIAHRCSDVFLGDDFCEVSCVWINWELQPEHLLYAYVKVVLDSGLVDYSEGSDRDFVVKIGGFKKIHTLETTFFITGLIEY